MNKIAIYLRVSVEEFSSSVSESILNQKIYIHNYLDKYDEFKGFIREEYVDDGYSGTNENRPSFQRLIKDIKNRNIYCIIVKDLSRFMRDYIKLGDYLENILPFLGVRFISINDNYDSYNERSSILNIDMQFKSLLYDFYSKDISNKVKTAMDTQKKQGKFLSWNAPYGYMKDPNNKYKIILDPKTSNIVKKIFTLALEGKSLNTIAKIMNEENNITPSERKRELKSTDYSFMTIKGENHDKSIWMSSIVNRILSNENYTGTYVFNRVKKCMHKDRRFNTIESEKWERVYNNHEAIITIEQFNQVKKILKEKAFKGNFKVERGKKSVIQGVVKCKDCSHTMMYSHRSKHTKCGIKIYKYFRCRTCNMKGLGNNTCKVEDIEIQTYNILLDKINNQTINKLNNKIDISQNIENLERIKLNKFEEYKLGLITKEEFIEYKLKINKEIENQNNKFEILNRDDGLDKNINIKELTKEIVDKYIFKIYVKDNKVLDLIMK